MPFLLAARAFLGRIPKEVWIALGVLLALFALYRVGVSHGKHSRDPEVAALNRDLATAVENQATLQTALEEQNAAVALLATREAEARKAAAKAVEAGQKRAAELSGTKARLDALARSRGNVAAVPVPDEVAQAWKALK